MKVSIDKLYSLYQLYNKITTDSRQVEEGCLFFALKGENFDGNAYAQNAIEAGAAFAVIDDEKYDSENTLLVDNVLHALQQLARMHRRKYQFPVLAITGSNGKTTTKELINAVLSRKYRVTATKGNLNNHIGVPVTLLDIRDDSQLAIIEMGANHQGEIANLCSVAEPTHGLITNIGKAHLGGFGGYEGVIKAKSELYAWLRAKGCDVFVNEDNPLLMELTKGMHRIGYGGGTGVVARGNAIENTEYLEINWVTPDEVKLVATRLVGNYNFENVMAAICAGMYFNVPFGDIQEAISSYIPSNSRSQALKTAKNSIILDAYNANPTSMKAAIDNFRQVAAERKMVILGDMLELGDESLEEHRAVVKMTEESVFDVAVFVGPDFMKTVSGRFTSFRTSQEATSWLASQDFRNYTILVKGSRGIKMEKVLEAL